MGPLPSKIYEGIDGLPLHKCSLALREAIRKDLENLTRTFRSILPPEDNQVIEARDGSWQLTFAKGVRRYDAKQPAPLMACEDRLLVVPPEQRLGHFSKALG